MSKLTDIDLVLDEQLRIFVPRRNFRLVRPGDTAESIAAERASELADRVRRNNELREAMRAEYIARGLDPADLEKPMFDFSRE